MASVNKQRVYEDAAAEEKQSRALPGCLTDKSVWLTPQEVTTSQIKENRGILGKRAAVRDEGTEQCKARWVLGKGESLSIYGPRTW